MNGLDIDMAINLTRSLQKKETLLENRVVPIQILLESHSCKELQYPNIYNVEQTRYILPRAEQFSPALHNKISHELPITRAIPNTSYT